MIDCSIKRGRFIVSPTVPVGTEDIQYTASINGTVMFVGKTKYFGGDYEVDCSDFIETYLTKMTEVYNVVVKVVFSFDNGTSTQTLYLTWSADTINLPWDYPADALLQLRLCGFKMIDYDVEETSDVPVNVPLLVNNDLLTGKTINKLDKVTYMDRYGNTHNGSMTNSYEVECFIDPCWLKMSTGDDMEYEKVILALQNAKKAYLYLNSTAAGTNTISGIDTSGLHYNDDLEVRIKDIERIETYSSYSVEKKIPSYKITLEIFK